LLYVAVGTLGLGSRLAVVILGSLAVPAGEDFGEPFISIIGLPICAAAANLCYATATDINTSSERGSPNRNLVIFGIWFSVALTALPGMWAALAWMVTVVRGTPIL
jgi:hypothetical protein